ncbi:hypothetical protein AVDCRST_MAG84-4808 [uncultured Microcoleus sp.]|uniref:Uncharacterized protein n=1 Tax=uncultured Microcoleus sp. TaxID=259945 RepID=A0A6J4N5R6_9CYAN|nr:hypothetical protein AVDCRST_MAG84-4808 [uncultured Microcoleus sp.]
MCRGSVPTAEFYLKSQISVKIKLAIDCNRLGRRFRLGKFSISASKAAFRVTG